MKIFSAGKIQNYLQKQFVDLDAAKVIVLSFIIVITTGALLLTLPISSVDGKSTPFLDCLFTSTSAVCVTGLVLYNTFEKWTMFGKVVILALIQIGGLGLMSLLTTFFVILGKKITLKERIIIQQSFNINTLQGMVKLLKKVVFGTLLVELIGAFILAIRFSFNLGSPLRGAWFGIFHAISAFCNAGFDIIGSNSLADFVSDPTVSITVMALIVLGGLGFAVWIDLMDLVAQFLKKRHLRRNIAKLSLSTKLALLITFILIMSGAVFFIAIEYNNPNTMQSIPLGGELLGAFFQSVSPRTAGFFTISQGGLTNASKFFTIILMFVGGSPGGTAGGIKTVTAGVLILSVISVIKGRDSIVAFNKSIPFELLQRSLAVILLNLTIISVSAMILSISEANSPFKHEFIDLLFETTSATGTVGLTTGITPYLTSVGKTVIILCMFLGRVGPITALFTVTKQKNNYVHYPEEKVMIG